MTDERQRQLQRAADAGRAAEQAMRADLEDRFRRAHDYAKLTAVAAQRAADDRGALAEALVRDGASYSEIGALVGIGKQAVKKILDRYRRRLTEA